MIERYNTPEMSRIWSDEHRYRAWLKVEIAVCEVQTERGVIPAEAMKSRLVILPADLDISRSMKHLALYYLY